MSGPRRVLLIEDEAPQREVLRLYLEQAGLTVLEATTGPEGWDLFRRGQPDLVLLDLMLPGLSGEALCRKIREVSSLPLLVMTAKVQEETALAVFALGADDFLRKPFSPREAAARVVRRLGPAPTFAADLTCAALNLTIRLDQLTARVGDQPLDLTPQEFDLLVVLLRQPERVFSREDLIRAAWPNGFDGSDRTVDVHIKNLRRKLPRPSGGPSPVQTVYGHGYRWVGK